MGNSNKNGEAAQGADSQVAELPSDTATVKQWVGRDLKAAITLLQAIDQDEDLKQMMSEFLHGRILNWKNRQELQKQGDLFNPGGPKRAES